MRAALVLFATMSVAHAQPAPSAPIVVAQAPTPAAGTPSPSQSAQPTGAPAPTTSAPVAPTGAPTGPTTSAPTGTPSAGAPSAPPPIGGEPAPPTAAQQPPPAAPVNPPRTGVMARRWSVALGFGTESMRPQEPADAATFALATLEVSGRFRIIPAIELALSLQIGGSYNGLYSTSLIMADFRYRFLAERALNAYALVGLGGGSANGKDPTDMEKQGRGGFRIGGGGELRFDPLAVFAEVRLYGIGENKQVPDMAPPLTQRYEVSRYGVSGIGLVLGANWYF